MVLLKTFGDTGVDLQLNEQARRATELHNEKVKKNSEILKRLIDWVMFLGKQELFILFFGLKDQSLWTRNG
jgi:hypothetical protein